MNSLQSEHPFSRLLELIRTLRGENGCPWDRIQTPGTVIPYLLEETFEALDAFEKGDPQEFKSELGDLLFQILFLAEMESESKRFSIEDVLSSITEKMIRRHPHVFGTDQVSEVSQVVEAWHRIKQEERREKSAGLLDSVPRNLPALMFAHRVGRKASKAGFDWQDVEGVLEKIEEELGELRESIRIHGTEHPSVREELGDLLFAAANLSRFLNVPAEFALRNAVRKFIRRFEQASADLESAHTEPESISAEALDAVWEKSKASEQAQISRDPEWIARAEEKLGYRFSQPDLLRRAFCHDSYANEHPEEFKQSNERLEFLGDAVLSLLTSTRLYHRFPEAPEGDLSKRRASLVNAQSLARAASALGLDEFVLLGRGEEASGGRRKDSILSDVMESVLGALYLDGGTEAAATLVERALGEKIRSGDAEPGNPDYKSRLQETTYALFKLLPEYLLIDEQGPDHDKTFWVESQLDGRSLAVGAGRTKKDAAQQAARAALRRIESGWRP